MPEMPPLPQERVARSLPFEFTGHQIISDNTQQFKVGFEQGVDEQ